MSNHDEGEVCVQASHVGLVRRGFASGLGWIALVLMYAPILLMWCMRAVGANTLAGNLSSALGLMTLGAPVLAVLGFALLNKKPGGGATLVASEGGLKVLRTSTLDAVRVHPRSSILSGVLVPLPSGARVEIEIEGNDVLVANLASREEAERLLAALALDPAHRRVRMRAGKNTPPVLLGIAFTFLAALLSTGTLKWFDTMSSKAGARIAWLACVSVIGWVLARVVAAPEVIVGTDGVAIQSWRTRLVSYRELAGVEAVHGQLILYLRDGSNITFGSRSKIGPPAENCAALAARIRAAMHSREATADTSALKLLERDARPFEAWRAALHGLVERANDYRDRSLSRDELVRVLKDPTARNDHRIGAALTLRTLDPEQAPKIRVAAETCADEHLRIALEKAADDELDEDTVDRATRTEERRET